MRKKRTYKLILSILLIIGVSFAFSRVNAAATITVNSSADNTTAGDGFCTLREAITNSDSDSDTTGGDCTAGSGTDSIEFNITSNEGAGPHTINLSSDLPDTHDAFIVDGYSETGASENTAEAPDPFNGAIMVQIDGGGTVDRGFWIGAGSDGSTIKGLSITGFDIDGILLEPSDDHHIVGNYIGVQPDGSTQDANNNGVTVNNSDDDIIGGTSPADRNVISGNSGSGISIDASLNTSNNLQIQGNYIGVASDGTTDLGNSSYGINVGYDDVTIGGTASGSINVISGNGADGIRVNARTSLTIQGNYIGTDYTGNVDLGNDNTGVALHGGGSHTVGGTSSSARNIISGNGIDGIFLASSSNNNNIQGNYIGVGADGTTDVGNTSVGVEINSGSSSNLVGGTVAGAANVIKRNDDNGVTINNDSSDNNAIIGNSTARNATPNIDIGNNGSTANDTGDGDSGPNDELNYPVWNTVTETGGNTDTTYSLDVPAGDYRIETFSDNGDTLIDTQNITHTGSGSEDFSNTISGDGYNSLRMTATEIDSGEPSGFGSTSEYSDVYSSGFATITVNSTADDEDDDGECTFREAINAANDNAESGEMDGECVAGAGSDTIEFDITGAGPHTISPASTLPTITSNNITIDGYSQTGALENTATNSVCFDGTLKIVLDGTSSGSGNGLLVQADNFTARGLVVTNFPGHGIYLNSGTGNTVSGNFLGLGVDGTSDEGNGDAGVGISTNGILTIGGTSPEDRNIISGNDGYGGITFGTSETTSTITGNCVGTNADGDLAVPNNHYGINFFESTGNITVGGISAGSRNIISGNDEFGISVGDDSLVESIIGNYIGTDITGNTALGNGSTGIFVGTNATVNNIGGTSTGSRNIISANGAGGIDTNSDETAEIANIRGNYIGLGADGLTDLGNTGIGIQIYGNGSNIGGTVNGSRNVISGNTVNAVNIMNSTLQGNLIGYSADGSTVIANGGTQSGSVNLHDNNQVGGTTNSSRNFIASGGVSAGVTMFGGSPFGGDSTTGNKIQGNCIGTDLNCEIASGYETTTGVIMAFDAIDNVVGGTSKAARNIIAGNNEGVAGFGISGASFIPLNNSIIGNSIHSNVGGSLYGIVNTDGIGIDWFDNPTGDFTTFTDVGINSNDSGDGDSKTNDYINYPVIDSVTASTGQFDVQFDLDVPDDAPNGYRIEFFANDTGDVSGNGEGQYYLGYTNVDGSGDNQTATITLDPGLITTGDYDITATTTERDNSTDGFGATSEFSAHLDDQHIIQPADNDGDGVNDSIEDGGPNGGDGNGDGTQDSLQSYVATILANDGTHYLTLALDPDGACTQIDDFTASSEASTSDADPDYDYPLGLNSFTIPCADNVEGIIYYHGYSSLSDYTHRKYGPTTPGDSATNGWYNSGFTYSTADIGGNTVATAGFSLTDGSRGDDTANDDSIVDDNGPGQAVESSNSNNSNGSDLANTGQNRVLYLLFGTSLVIISGLTVKRFKAKK